MATMCRFIEPNREPHDPTLAYRASPGHDLEVPQSHTCQRREPAAEGGAQRDARLGPPEGTSRSASAASLEQVAMRVGLLALLVLGLGVAVAEAQSVEVHFLCPNHDLDSDHEVVIYDANSVAVRQVSGIDPPLVHDDVVVPVDVATLPHGFYVARARAMNAQGSSDFSDPSAAIELGTAPPVNACEADPLRVTVTTWPSNPGGKGLVYTSSHTIASFSTTSSKKVITAIRFTDIRSCSVTVTR